MRTGIGVVWLTWVVGAWGVGPEAVMVRPVLAEANRAAWVFDGTGAWRLGDGELRLEAAGVPAGPIRRPAAIALWKDPMPGRVRMEAEVRSTAEPGLAVADVLLIFGYQSPTRFYYVHLSGKTDAVHNGIFLVDDADRRRIDAGDAQPQLRDRDWHPVRLTHDPESGHIQVFLDRAAEPGLVAVDRTLGAGLVGFGSFDDTARIRHVRIAAIAPSAPAPPATP